MKWATPLAIVACSLCSACVPRFVDVPPAPTRTVWVERAATTVHSMIGSSTSREIVEIDTAENRFLSADERVIWLAGVDPQKSRFQRIHQRASDQWTALQSPGARREDAIVEVFKFPVSEGELSVEAQLSVEKFRSDAKARYYVEFLNRSAMSEETVNSMLSVWKALSSRLKERGMNMSNVVLGGNKYDQGIDAVVMVRVGR